MMRVHDLVAHAPPGNVVLPAVLLWLTACSTVDQEQIFVPDDCARSLQREGTRYYSRGRTGFPSSECLQRIRRANAGKAG